MIWGLCLDSKSRKKAAWVLRLPHMAVTPKLTWSQDFVRGKQYVPATSFDFCMALAVVIEGGCSSATMLSYNSMPWWIKIALLEPCSSGQKVFRVTHRIWL